MADVESEKLNRDALRRDALRKAGISARNSLTETERREKSGEIVRKILQSEEFAGARTIMLYRAVRGEVLLEELAEAAQAMGKLSVYPLCTGEGQMIAMAPDAGADSWMPGRYGIMEPVKGKSTEIEPREIDLIICPCTAFDCSCGRMGMGAGYYDRYLPLCVNASIAGAAFEVQKQETVLPAPWDRPMDKIFTEKKVYSRQGKFNQQAGEALIMGQEKI